MSKGQLLVSVALITYNHEKYIIQSLDSVLMQQTVFDFEIVIGEDYSTDNTREIIQTYQSEYPERIKLVTSESNVGPMPNVVRTYKACKGKYIAILEGDDYWTDPLKLQKQVDLLENNPDFSMCFTDRSTIDENEKILRKTTVPDNKKHTLDAYDIIGNYTPPTQTVVFRKELLSNLIYAGLQKVPYGDIFLFSVLSIQGKAGFIDRITAHYRLHSSSNYSHKNYIDKLENRIQTYEVLKEYMPKNKRILLNKGIAVAYQRQYVLLFKNRRFTSLIKKTGELIIFDLTHKKLSFAKANKLLFKHFFNKEFIITD